MKKSISIDEVKKLEDLPNIGKATQFVPKVFLEVVLFRLLLRRSLADVKFQPIQKQKRFLSPKA